MDVGVIAAGLIVMRPCFRAVHNTVVTWSRFQEPYRARKNRHDTRPRVAGFVDKVIMRTVVLELESQPVSTREVTPRDLI